MTERAAHRPAIAGLKMTDMRNCRRDQREPLRFSSGQPRPRPALWLRHLDRSGALSDVSQLVETGDVDEDRRPHQAHVEHCHQRLTARHHARVVAVLGSGASSASSTVSHRRSRNSPASSPCSEVFAVVVRLPAGAGAAPSAEPRDLEKRRKNSLMRWRAAPSSIRPPIIATRPDRWMS